MLKPHLLNDKIEIIVIISIIITVFAFLLLSGTLVSGYHFQDDHEIIRIKDDLKTSTVLSVSKKWITEDIHGTRRFRPLYYFHRVIETKIFGSDFLLWSLYTGALACLTMIFFFLAMRNLKYNTGSSIVFMIVAFAGSQMAVWWRLGPNETIGITFFALSFYFMSRSIFGRGNIINNSLFILFLILSSLSKESFIIIIPGVLFFKIYMEKIANNITLRDALQKNILLLVPIIVIVFELAYIVSGVGTIQAFDSGIHSKLIGCYNCVIILVKTYPYLGFVGCVLLLANFILKNSIFELKWLPVILALLILIPNIVLYSRGGIWERYLLPSSVGFGFVVASILNGIKSDFLKAKIIIYLSVLISLSPLMLTSYNNARKFAEEGAALKSLLGGIRQNYIEGTNVLAVVDPINFYEQSYSLKTYLFLEQQITLYGYPLIKSGHDESYNSLINGWKGYFSGVQYEDLKSLPNLIIFLDTRLVKDFFNITKIDQEKYSQVLGISSSFALLKLNPHL